MEINADWVTGFGLGAIFSFVGDKVLPQLFKFWSDNRKSINSSILKRAENISDEAGKLVSLGINYYSGPSDPAKGQELITAFKNLSTKCQDLNLILNDKKYASYVIDPQKIYSYRQAITSNAKDVRKEGFKETDLVMVRINEAHARFNVDVQKIVRKFI